MNPPQIEEWTDMDGSVKYMVMRAAFLAVSPSATTLGGCLLFVDHHGGPVWPHTAGIDSLYCEEVLWAEIRPNLINLWMTVSGNCGAISWHVALQGGLSGCGASGP